MTRVRLAAALIAIIAIATILSASHVHGFGHPPLMFARLAYIHDQNADAGDAYKTFLFEHERASVTLVDFRDITATDFSGYDAVLIDPFAGWHASSTLAWTDDGSAAATHLRSFDVPVVGLGFGGGAYFEAAGGYDITYSHSGIGSSVNVRVVDASHPVWNTPYDLEVETGDEIPVVTADFEVSVLFDEDFPGVTLVGGSSNPVYFPLVEEDGAWLWGWFLGPQNLTEAGKDLFVNVLARVIGPPAVYSTFAPGASANP